jgi:D-mannonate dehydratase
VLTALHEVHNGVVWPGALIVEPRAVIEAVGLARMMVERARKLPMMKAIIEAFLIRHQRTAQIASRSINYPLFHDLTARRS